MCDLSSGVLFTMGSLRNAKGPAATWLISHVENYSLIPYAFQMAFLGVTGLFVANVQVLRGTFLLSERKTIWTMYFVIAQISTRLLGAACPLLYWTLADEIILEASARGLMFLSTESNKKALQTRNLPPRGSWVLLWVAGFNCAGTLLHPSGYPWT